MKYSERLSILEENEAAMEVAMDYEGIYTWIFHLDTGYCRFCPSLRRLLNLPESTHSYLDCIFEKEIFSKEDWQLYESKVEEIRKGAKTLTFEMKGLFNGKEHWIRLRISALPQENADARMVVGTASAIDTEKHMEARVKLEQDRIRRAGSEMSAYTVSDLTRGVIVDHSIYAPNAPAVEKTRDYEENIDEALQSVVYEDDRKEFIRIHNVAYLLTEFEQGRTSLIIAFRRRQKNGMIGWVKNVLHLVEDPATAHIMLYEYCYDINDTKSVEVVTNAAILQTFDCLSSIDLIHDQTTYLSQKNVRLGKNVVLDHYHSVYEKYIQEMVTEEYQDGCRNAFALENIREKLACRDTFEYTYHIKTEDGKIHIMRNKYVYYDRKKYRCLMMRTDVTELVRLENEQRHRIQLAQVMGAFPGGIVTLDVRPKNNGRYPIIYCAKGVADLAGYDVNTFVDLYENNTDVLIFSADQEAIHEQMERLAKTGQPLDITYRAIHKDGSVFWVREYAGIMHEAEEGSIMVAVFQNVSEDTKLYQDIIDSSDDFIQVIDQETREVYYANKAAMNQCGIQDYAGLHCYEFFGKRSRPCEFCNYQDGKIVSQEMYVAQTGQVLKARGNFMEWHGRKVYTEILTDVTKQKEMQSNYESYIAAITQTSMEALIAGNINISQDFCIQNVSKFDGFHPGLSGKSIEAFVNSVISFVQDQEERSEYFRVFNRENLMKEFRKGNNTVSLRHHSELSNHQIVIVQSNVQMMVNPKSGDIEGIFFAKDITDDTITDQIFNRLLLTSYEMVELIDTIHGTCNIRSLSGKNTKESLQRVDYIQECREYAQKEIHPDDADLFLEYATITCLTRKLERAQTFCFTARTQLNGHIRVKRYNYCYLGGGTSTIMCAREDVTEIVAEAEMQNQRLQEALRAAQAATRAKSDFLARMSHDMRTPMNGIVGMTKLIEGIPNLPKEARENLSAISDSSDFLLGLINDTLDMNKIESGKLVLNPEVVKLEEVLKNVLTTVEPLAGKKKIDLQFVSIHAKMGYIYVDRIRLQQICMNILSNAIKFTPEHGKICMELECLKREDGVDYDRISVQDNGIGMSEAFLEHVFEPFSQEKEYSATGMVGTGLGLSIVKRLVELMDGRIQIESTKGVGTKVSVYIHFRSALGENRVGKVLEKNADYHLEGTKVLLVEDHPLNARIAAKLLEKEGVTVECAENGAVGVQMFEEAKPGTYHAILMDIRMPVMDGLEATRKIRALKRKDASTVPIIAMTANAFAEDVRAARNAGMDAHLSKPVQVEKLYSTLKAGMKTGHAKKRYCALVVDDVEMNREVVSAAIESEVKILQAENGFQALKILEEHPEINVVITDIIMPQMDGKQLVKEIRKKECYAHIPIIVNTQFGDRQLEEELLLLGINDFIYKPISSQMIRMRLQNVLK